MHWNVGQTTELRALVPLYSWWLANGEGPDLEAWPDFSLIFLFRPHSAATSWILLVHSFIPLCWTYFNVPDFQPAGSSVFCFQ